MAGQTRSYPPDEFTHREKAFYDQVVHPVLTFADTEKLVAPGIDSEGSEFDPGDLIVCHQHFPRDPEAVRLRLTSAGFPIEDGATVEIEALP